MSIGREGRILVGNDFGGMKELSININFFFLGLQLQCGSPGSIYLSSYSILRMCPLEAGQILFFWDLSLSTLGLEEDFAHSKNSL
jgi:hypothetical protein